MSGGPVLSVELCLQRGTFSLDVAFRTGPGVLAVVGPNGAGKSTLLRAILGAEPCQTARASVGEVVLDDSAAGIHLPTEQRRVAYLPQTYGLFPHWTVAQNVRFALDCAAGSLSPAEQERHLQETAARFGIQPLLGRWPASLSGGERQRVGLARALATAPRALMLDEPLAALDPVARVETLSYLRPALAALAIPVLVVSHDAVDVRTLADRVLVLEGGRLTAEGTVAEVARAAKTPFVAAFFGA